MSFIFMSRTLGLSSTAIGIVVALGSLTVMAGAALTPRLARRIGSARIVWLPLAVTGPLILLGPLAQPGWLVTLIVIGAAAGELGQIIYAVTNVSLRQRLCPQRMLGRVNATMRFLIMGLFPLGALVGGTLGEVIGLRATLWLSQSIIALSPIPIYLALRHTRDVEQIPAWHAAPTPHDVGQTNSPGSRCSAIDRRRGACSIWAHTSSSVREPSTELPATVSAHRAIDDVSFAVERREILQPPLTSTRSSA